jgi:hypothetical protein
MTPAEMLGIRTWWEIPDDADALRPGAIISFVVRDSEALAYLYELTKQEGAITGAPWTWAKVADGAKTLKLGETLTFRMNNNNTAQTGEGEDLPPAYAFRLSLQAIIEGECPDFCREVQ